MKQISGWTFENLGPGGRWGRIGRRDIRKDPDLWYLILTCWACGREARLATDDTTDIRLCTDCHALTRLPRNVSAWGFCGKPADPDGGEYWINGWQEPPLTTYRSRPHFLLWDEGGTKPEVCRECAKEQRAATEKAAAKAAEAARQAAELEAETAAAARLHAATQTLVTAREAYGDEAEKALAEFRAMDPGLAVQAADSLTSPPLAPRGQRRGVRQWLSEPPTRRYDPLIAIVVAVAIASIVAFLTIIFA